MNDSTTFAGAAPGVAYAAPTGGTAAYPSTAPAPAQSPWRLTTIAIVLTLLLGGIAGGWLAMTFLAEPRAAEVTKAAPTPQAVVQPVTVRPLVAAPPLSAAESGAMAARIGLLEERLARITLAAESASGNAARAEALLVAFAARRAVERGFPLGSMEAQLRLRFGESQPNAVDSILIAAANPMTTDDLRQRLETLRPVLIRDNGAGWASRIGSSLASLIVVRSADTPSSRPSRRFERALAALDNGRVDAAIAEVEAMPGHGSALATAWLTEARRYNDARRALDLIETAAILEPGANRDPAASGATTPAR